MKTESVDAADDMMKKVTGSGRRIEVSSSDRRMHQYGVAAGKFGRPDWSDSRWVKLQSGSRFTRR